MAIMALMPTLYSLIAILVLWRVCENSFGTATINLVMWQAGNGQQLCCKSHLAPFPQLKCPFSSNCTKYSSTLNATNIYGTCTYYTQHSRSFLCYCQYYVFAPFFHENALIFVNSICFFSLTFCKRTDLFKEKM